MNLTKVSNPFLLALVLLVVCGAATAIMATTAVMTKEPIEKASAAKLVEGLKSVLPAVDNDPSKDFFEVKMKKDDGQEEKTIRFYVGRRNGAVVGYAAESSAKGYGGDVTGLVGFKPDGTADVVIIQSHNETPGIGTIIVERTRKRTISDLFRGAKPEEGLPPNQYLDSYKGRKAGSAKWDKDEVDFRTGATISSVAVRDLVWDAASALERHLNQGGK